MLEYYMEATLLPQDGINLYFIWHKLYQQVHLALVEHKSAKNTSNIGVSFPEYHCDNHCLGKKLRLFAENESILEQLNINKWLCRLKDYVLIYSIRTVPEKVSNYASFKHIKFKGKKEKLARRRAKRKGESFQQALGHFEGFEEQRSKLPYINMISRTNGHHFRLFIERQIMSQPKTGVFSCYGLSHQTTVPIF